MPIKNRIKAGPDAPKRTTFVTKAVVGIDSEARTIRAYASTNAWDRYGERFEARAFEGEGMKHFKKNPVILYGHNYGEGGVTPIGKAIAWEFDSKGLILTMKFADTAFAKEVFSLYEGGFMNAFSVGFRPLEVAFEERVKGSGEMGAVFVRAELLENSAVPVPANPEAVVIKGIGGKEIKLSDIEAIMARHPEEEPAGVELTEGGVVTPAPATVGDGASESVIPLDPEKKITITVEGQPKNLKEAIGYLLVLGEAARGKGKVEDDAVRALLVNAVNLCRELVKGPSSVALDGIDPADDQVAPEDAALIAELDATAEKLFASGKATQKDKDELAELAKFIHEKLVGKKDTI